NRGTSVPGSAISVEKGSVPLTPLLLAALPVFLIFLGANSIWDANEAFYVETPRQMVISGDYVNPVFNDAPRLNKPVLSYWIVAGLYNLFGVSVAVERLGIALGALGIIAATFLIGRALRSTSTGLLAALFVATAPRFVMFSRRIFIDIYITLFIALSLAFFVMAERFPEHRRRYLLLMYVAMGLGVLTKGPVAIALPLLAGGIWLAMEGRWRDVFRLHAVAGIAIVLAIVSPWYIAIVAERGWDPLRQFVLGENVERFTTSMVPGAREFWFYVPVLLGDLFPWAPLVIVPLVAAWRPRASEEDAAHASIRRLLWIWIVAIFVFFTISRTKQDLYLLPVAPAVAVLVADALESAGFGATHRGLRYGLLTIAIVTGLAGVGLPWLLGSGYYAVAGIWPTGGVLVATGVMAAVLILRGGFAPAIAVFAAGFVALNYLFVARVLPDVERFKPVEPLARTFLSRASPDARLGSYAIMLPSLVYYAGRPVTELPVAPYNAEGFLETTKPSGELAEAWLITGSNEWAEIQPLTPNACVADRRHLFAFNEKLGRIASGVPPPDLLLITNRCR
ncbi:MAG TPA: glycosyltransferase family 39 protein, partial [Vicinamibacterales bacterium]|nr:glycosyltransferase family 39 protein [Vicinamibacterales bacterium]